MSSRLKVKNVNMSMGAKSKRARVSDCCGHGHKDNAVAGIQEAGRELSNFFDKLQMEANAARLVRAIRCRSKRVIEDLLGPDCQVVCFFRQGRYSCVRITCVFGSCCDVRITFDICVSNGPCGPNLTFN
ncbi:hypothetical protein [Paenibacillus xanthanilyticus]|uniref:Uncharacterized protein n=1 Tax=Paenibacillus xanthanilyticus TaxID=1783531 RepID=A0ABV8K204_9BACL